jgi:ATPase subunit of ABC transporter with duplicated ATPase domains
MVVIFESYGLTKSFGHKDILKEASLKIEDNDKIGLIGANGVGKSTLLGIIAGTINEDAGKIRKKRESENRISKTKCRNPT